MCIYKHRCQRSLRCACLLGCSTGTCSLEALLLCCLRVLTTDQLKDCHATGAAWAALEYPDADIRCITFGSPRVANKVFGKAFNALVGTSLRLVHGFDPVPSLPPSLM